MDESVRVARSGRIAEITLARPARLNALDIPGMSALRTAVHRASLDQDVRAVLITGEGRAFCSGGDVGVMDASVGESELAELFYLLSGELEVVIREIMLMPKPVVAALPGVAAGGGLSLALACDWRVASSDAHLVAAFSRLGAVPDGGLTYLLPHYLGLGTTQEILFGEGRIAAARARELGLVHDVVPPDRVLQAGREKATELSEGPTFAYGWVKRLLVSAFSHGLETQLSLERTGVRDAGKSNDLREGIRAFVEKRAPRFKGS